jgi:hypothetical protein
MSTPEEIQSETQSDQPMDVAAAVGQLRLLVCGLGAGLIFVSLALSAFVIKQNRDLAAATNNRERQIAQLQATQKPAMAALNELAKYSIGKPELTALFTKHGLQFTPPGAAAPQR